MPLPDVTVWIIWVYHVPPGCVLSFSCSCLFNCQWPTCMIWSFDWGQCFFEFTQINPVILLGTASNDVLSTHWQMLHAQYSSYSAAKMTSLGYFCLSVGKKTRHLGRILAPWVPSKKALPAKAWHACMLCFTLYLIQNTALSLSYVTYVWCWQFGSWAHKVIL